MIGTLISRGKEMLNYESQHNAAHGLLHTSLKEAYGIEKDRIIKSSFGKPSLSQHRNIHISIAHTEGAAAVSVSTDRTGIDMEKIRPFDWSAAERILTEKEMHHLLQSEERDITFFRYFTLKESYVKALGCGIFYPMRNLEFSFTSKETALCAFPAEFLTKEADGYILSVCRLGKIPTDRLHFKEKRTIIP